jgi:hypothetical protein
MTTEYERAGQAAGGAPDPIDALLREAARREAYVDDAGFTEKVMAGLAPPVPLALRRRILWAFGALACLVGLGANGGAFLWNAAFEAVSRWSFGAPQLALFAIAVLFYWFLLSSIDRRTLR